jgi:predicted RNase H-like nuclease (RuvC/YqgF family)
MATLPPVSSLTALRALNTPWSTPPAPPTEPQELAESERQVQLLKEVQDLQAQIDRLLLFNDKLVRQNTQLTSENKELKSQLEQVPALPKNVFVASNFKVGDKVIFQPRGDIYTNTTFYELFTTKSQTFKHILATGCISINEYENRTRELIYGTITHIELKSSADDKFYPYQRINTQYYSVTIERLSS